MFITLKSSITDTMYAGMFHVAPTLWCQQFLKIQELKKATVVGLTGKCEVPVRQKKSLCYGWAVCSSLGIKALCFTAVFFSSAAPNHTPPSHPLAETRWDLSSHWLQDTQGRIQEPLFCLHAGREKPTNNCYLGQPGNLKLAVQKCIMLEQPCMRTHTHTVK